MNDTARPTQLNDPNTPRSGYGAHPSWARWAIHALEDVIQDFGIQSVLDAPCGDMTWMPLVNLQGARYTGVDIVSAAIEDHRTRLAERTDMSFQVMDIVKDVPPAHLTQGDGLRALQNWSKSGSKYLMITTFLEGDENDIRLDVVHGFYSINLLRPPFSLPPPLRMYLDNPVAREYLAVWELPLWQS